jgi:drug/metabolite transporter (DMT)-like permease
VLINKRLLSCLDPVATNMLVRVVSVVTIVVVTAPLTLLHKWSLTYDMTWAAAGYVTILAVVGWLIAQNAYYFALRSGRVSVVAPITSTDLLFTALFATVFIGGVLGNLTLTGLFITVAGIFAIARADREDAVAAADGLAAEGVLVAAPAVDEPRPAGWARSVPLVIVLALIGAAGWGMAPVLIQLAVESVGGASVTMIVMAQGLGLLMTVGVASIRRVPLTTRKLTPVERRRARRLTTITGVLEGSCAVLFYLIIEHLGSVQTALIAATVPVFAIFWSILFLHERLSRRLTLGIVVTLLGVFLATVDRLR